MASFFRGANTSVLAGRAVAEVDFDFTVTSHVSRFAIAVVIIDKLDAILSAGSSTGIGEAFVDVTFAPRTDETRWALALEASNLVDARAIVVAGVSHAVIWIDLADVTESAGWTRTAEVVDEIVAGASVLARIQATVVDVEFTVLSLKTFCAITLIRSNQVSAGRTVLAWGRVALVDFGLTITAGIALVAHAAVTVANVFASTVVAQSSFGYAFSKSRVLAGNHLDVANLSGPAWSTLAFVFVAMLNASSLIFTGRLRTPINVLFASFTRESVGTMAGEILHVIVASGAIFARIAVALVDAVLTVGAGVARSTDAGVVVYTVDAGSTVHAGRVGAVFVVGLAVYTRKAESTLAGVGVDVLLANGTVLTGIRKTLVDVDFAMLAVEAVHAEARVVANAIETGTAVLTRT